MSILCIIVQYILLLDRASARCMLKLRKMSIRVRPLNDDYLRQIICAFFSYFLYS